MSSRPPGSRWSIVRSFMWPSTVLIAAYLAAVEGHPKDECERKLKSQE